MSIPPLVCSTPPPPEQCEDDKDHEDFDISYNLSQEDDEDSNEYNYGNYTSYDIYKTKADISEKQTWDSSLKNSSDDKNAESETCDKNGLCILVQNEFIESSPKFEENIIEDLNLTVDKESVHSNEKDFETEADVDSNYTIQDEGGTNVDNIKERTTTNDSMHDLSIPEDINVTGGKNEDINIVEDLLSDIHEISLAVDSPSLTNENDDISRNLAISNLAINTDINSSINEKKSHDESIIEDEFGDFEDFQFTASNNCQVLTVNNENPWENDGLDGPEFGDFTANFDVPKAEEKLQAKSNEEEEVKTGLPLKELNDDFGDFDDFRSSNTDKIEIKEDIASVPEVTFWNLSTPDNDLQIIDSINSLLTSIFTDEICEPKTELLGNLESFLRETWGHLIEIDIRQPYMVNWNNSLGQKTLLKALCIDSRNILFGPKWNYNMPKYAVNLSAAPLQPKKQAVYSSSCSESTDKVANKEAGTWVDPFTPDGQEYTYAEALLLDLEHLMATLDQMAHKHSTLKISELLSHACNADNESASTEAAKRPTDLNVFESDSATKLGKIYSSTINVQPLRHINLPDTHIFTPTDSETPRSKTIHYDSGPSTLIPQTVQDIKTQSEDSPQISDSVEKEYWDFQDFKGSNTVTSLTETVTPTDEITIENSTNSTSEPAISKPAMTYHTQILQPIKLDPIMPTLNWPDPGEVKETFDDFSDFISSSLWNNEKDKHSHSSANTKELKMSKDEIMSGDSIDDEFETFQSAPTSTSGIDVNATVSHISARENIKANVVEITNIPPIESSYVKIPIKVNLENHASISNNVSDVQDFSTPQSSSGIQSMGTDILQPTSASSSGLNRQHKSDQILQPLSLESYSQINWPNPGIDLQDLSRFNPINSLHSLKRDSSPSGSKNTSPAHSANIATNQTSDDDIWGDFVSSAPKPTPKKVQTFADDDEWTDFVSSPSIKPQNGLNTISFNVHTNLSMQKSSNQNKLGPRNQIPLDIPTLNYITPKSSSRGIYSEKHFQNL